MPELTSIRSATTRSSLAKRNKVPCAAHSRRNEQEVARGHLPMGLPGAARTVLDRRTNLRTSSDLLVCREIRSVSKGWASYVASKGRFAALEATNGARRHINADATLRIRLSDKTSRLHPRHVVPKPAQAYEPKVPVKMREWIGPALATPGFVLELQPPAQPHRCVAVECSIRLADGAYLEVVRPSAQRAVHLAHQLCGFLPCPPFGRSVHGFAQPCA